MTHGSHYPRCVRSHCWCCNNCKFHITAMKYCYNWDMYYLCSSTRWWMEWWVWYSSLASAPDLGHGRTGEVQNHHSELLPRVTWGDSGLRHHQWRDIQSRTTVGRWCEEICRWVWRNWRRNFGKLGEWHSYCLFGSRQKHIHCGCFNSTMQSSSEHDQCSFTDTLPFHDTVCHRKVLQSMGMAKYVA